MAVKDPGDDVAVKDVAAGESSGKVKVTVAEPLLNALPDPALVAVPMVGADGSKKSFDACDFFPAFLPAAILYLLVSY